jgi:hypothetical protein
MPYCTVLLYTDTSYSGISGTVPGTDLVSDVLLCSGAKKNKKILYNSGPIFLLSLFVIILMFQRGRYRLVFPSSVKGTDIAYLVRQSFITNYHAETYPPLPPPPHPPTHLTHPPFPTLSCVGPQFHLVTHTSPCSFPPSPNTPVSGGKESTPELEFLNVLWGGRNPLGIGLLYRPAIAT